jgi:hypothetical protein
MYRADYLGPICLGPTHPNWANRPSQRKPKKDSIIEVIHYSLCLHHHHPTTPSTTSSTISYLTPINKAWQALWKIGSFLHKRHRKSNVNLYTLHTPSNPCRNNIYFYFILFSYYASSSAQTHLLFVWLVSKTCFAFCFKIQTWIILWDSNLLQLIEHVVVCCIWSRPLILHQTIYIKYALK